MLKYCSLFNRITNNYYWNWIILNQTTQLKRILVKDVLSFKSKNKRSRVHRGCINLSMCWYNLYTSNICFHSSSRTRYVSTITPICDKENLNVQILKKSVCNIKIFFHVLCQCHHRIIFNAVWENEYIVRYQCSLTVFSNCEIDLTIYFLPLLHY